MPYMNHVVLMGHLGKEPDVRYTQNGTVITSFSLATASPYKDKSGEWHNNTQWHNVVTFGNSAEKAAALARGQLALVEGEVTYEQWEDKQGNKRTTTKIKAFRVLDLRSKEEKQETPTPANSTNSEPEMFDDDIPF